MSRTQSFVTVALVSVGLMGAGCGGVDGPSEWDDSALIDVDASGEKADSARSTSTFYKFRHDMRRCLSPVCGGYFISRVNFTKTKCVDGSWQSECYVTGLDTRALGADANLERVTLLRGTLKPQTFGTFGTYALFVVSEAWAPINDGAPTGLFHRMTDSGIRCVRAPCPTIRAAKLNSTIASNVTDVDFTSSGGTPAELRGSRPSMYTDGFLAVGAHSAQGEHKTFVVSQYFKRVRGANVP